LHSFSKKIFVALLNFRLKIFSNSSAARVFLAAVPRPVAPVFLRLCLGRWRRFSCGCASAVGAGSLRLCLGRFPWLQPSLCGVACVRVCVWWWCVVVCVCLCGLGWPV
jgi:hypothetical protein